MPDDSENKLVLEGMLAVSAALSAGNRRLDVLLAGARLNPRRLAYLKRLAQQAGVPMKSGADREIAAHQSGGSHGGVLALASPRRYQQFADLVAGRDRPLLLMLDGIEDPYSMGWAVRSAWAAGVDGLVLRERDWGASEPLICRASAGAFDLMPVALAADPFEAAEFCKAAGLQLVLTGQGEGSTSLFSADLTQPILVFVGGERRGVQRRFRELADVVLEIPYGRKFNAALGAASAATVVAFEALRQRQAAGRLSNPGAK